jgi:hypothetical protein
VEPERAKEDGGGNRKAKAGCIYAFLLCIFAYIFFFPLFAHVPALGTRCSRLHSALLLAGEWVIWSSATVTVTNRQCDATHLHSLGIANAKTASCMRQSRLITMRNQLRALANLR